MDNPVDSRRNGRFKVQDNIVHDNLLPGIFYNAKMVNLSKVGLYFESDQVLYADEEIYIGIKSPQQNDVTPKNLARVKVRWRKELRDAQYRYGYGAEFADANNPLVKKYVFPKFDPKDPHKEQVLTESDPRGHNRRFYRKVTILSSNKRRYKGIITNISRGGAFIITQKKFALGQTIKLAVPRNEQHNGVEIKSCVVRVDPSGVGVRFDRRLGGDRRSDLDRRAGLDRRTPKRQEAGTGF